MTRRSMLVAVIALGFLAGVGDAARQQGYLAPGAFDILQVLPAAPVRGDARYVADRKIFRQTRAMKGSARYEMATTDADYAPEAVARDFSCAVGVSLTPADAPRTFATIRRAAVDTAGAMVVAKDYYKRLRPYHIDHGDICQPKSDLGDSYDYPSGHTTWGWTWGIVLAEALPERVTPILARARAYGDSRFICGAHNYSAVIAGGTTAQTVMDVVRQTPAYQTDLATVRTELRALIANPATPRPSGCEAEAALVAQRVP